ncbi:MAG: hypothetical protein WC108_06320 [Bacteroidales bacterium]|jgi:hypothetical protein
MAKKKKISQLEMATLGGKSTYAKYGREHFSKMGNIRWKNERKKKREAAKAEKLK